LDIYIPHLSNRSIHAISILTKYFVRNFCELHLSANTRTPRKLSTTAFAPMANLSVCASVIPDGVETTSGVSSSVSPLTTIVTNYLAPVLTEGSLTHWTEAGQSSLVGSVENLASNCMSYFDLQALHDLSSGSYLSAFSLGLHLLPTCPLWMHPIHLLGRVTSFILYTSL